MRVRPLTVNGPEGPWSVVDVAAIEVVIENSWANIRLDVDDLKRGFREFLLNNPVLQEIADIGAQGHVLADAAHGEARAAVKQVALAQADASKALAIFGTELIAQWDADGTTVSTVTDMLSASVEDLGHEVVAQANAITSLSACTPRRMTAVPRDTPPHRSRRRHS